MTTGPLHTDKNAKQVTLCDFERKHMAAVITLLDENLTSFLPDPADHDAIWDRFAAQPNVTACVALSGNRVIGFGTIMMEVKIRGGIAAHIEDIVVAPEFRGRGIGLAIMDRLESRARELGCYKVMLACLPHNDAFYRAAGYDQHGQSMSKGL